MRHHHILRRISGNEVDRYTDDLEAAIEAHARWMEEVTQRLLADEKPKVSLADHPRPPPLPSERWCHGAEADRTAGEMRESEAARTRLEGCARSLLRRRRDGETLAAEELERFTRLGADWRHLARNTHRGILHNLAVVSRLMAKMFENALEGMMITTPDGTVIDVNRAFTDITGYLPEEIIGRTPSLLHSGRQSNQFYSHMWRTLAREGRWQGEIRNRRKNGEIYNERLSIVGIRDERGDISHYIGIFTDITAEKRNEERLYHLAHYDPLTGLPNRLLFQDRFEQALARARRSGRSVAVMFLDLDGFKKINDEHGHNAGDELLAQVASRLLGQLRSSDTVSRLGGDEFGVILPDMEEPDRAAAVARKVIAAIANPFSLGSGKEVGVTTSVGISIFPTDGLDPDDLIRCADGAMYEAKKRGKNRYCYHISPAAA